MAQFQIEKSIDKRYYYRLRATGNNEIILRSTMYSTKEICRSVISAVKANAPFDTRYEKLEAKNGQHYFNLTDGNAVIGTSEMYVSKAGRDHGITVVKAQASAALVKDLS